MVIGDKNTPHPQAEWMASKKKKKNTKLPYLKNLEVETHLILKFQKAQTGSASFCGKA